MSRCAPLSLWDSRGKRKAEFEELCDFVREAQLLSWMGAFAYSDQDGAGAFGLDKKLSPREIERRRKHLMGIQRQISKKKKKALVGREFDLLLEGTSDESDLLLEGRTAMHAPEIDGKVFVNDFSTAEDFSEESGPQPGQVLPLPDHRGARLRSGSRKDQSSRTSFSEHLLAKIVSSPGGCDFGATIVSVPSGRELQYFLSCRASASSSSVVQSARKT